MNFDSNKDQAAQSQTKGLFERSKQGLEDMATRASDKVSTKTHELVSEVGSRADEVVHATGETLSDAGAKLWNSAPAEGPVGEVLGAAAAKLESGGEYLAGTDLAGMTEDVTALIHKYPVQSVLLGLFVGGMLGMTFTWMHQASPRPASHNPQ